VIVGVSSFWREKEKILAVFGCDHKSGFLLSDF